MIQTVLLLAALLVSAHLAVLASGARVSRWQIAIALLIGATLAVAAVLTAKPH